MSGETTMYTLKTVITLPSVLHRSKVMYEMKNIHEERSTDNHMASTTNNEGQISEQKPLPEVSVLQTRQERILAELGELKKQVSVLCDFLKQFHETKSEKLVKSINTSQTPVSINLVINVNPKQIPYSIQVLPKIWNDTDIRIQSHVHSSINGTVLPYCVCSISTKKIHTVNITLIWKEVDDLEVITDLHGYPIIGEVNLLRYLSRSLNAHNYENSKDSCQPNVVNQLLDWCHSLRYSEPSSNETQEILSLIANKLSKEKWSDKNYSNIVNIALWSIVKQIRPKKIPKSINALFQSCEQYFTPIN